MGNKILLIEDDNAIDGIPWKVGEQMTYNRETNLFLQIAIDMLKIL